MTSSTLSPREQALQTARSMLMQTTSRPAPANSMVEHTVNSAALENKADAAGTDLHDTLDERYILAAGKLCLAGASNELPQIIAIRPDLLTIARQFIARANFDWLDDATTIITDEAAALDDDAGITENDVSSRVLQALNARERAELLMVGLGALLGESPQLSDDQTAPLEGFELLVRPILWRLIPLNAEREAALAWVDPSMRKKLWWWSEGVDVPRNALQALSTVAHLVQCFPSARSELDKAIQAERLFTRLVDAAPRLAQSRETVIRLEDWLNRQRAHQANKDILELPMVAGFESGEQLLLTESQFELSWQQPDRLIVDLLANRKEGAAPRLYIAGISVDGLAVPDCEERFEFRLEGNWRDATNVKLELPLATGILTHAIVGPKR